MFKDNNVLRDIEDVADVELEVYVEVGVDTELEVGVDVKIY